MSYQPIKKEYETFSLPRNMNDIVELPHSEGYNEWLAFHLIEFYHEISLLCKIIRPKFCTKKTCTRMNASSKTEYYWADDKNYKDPKMVTAPEYIDFLMEYIETTINDRNIFPVKSNDTPSTSVNPNTTNNTNTKTNTNMKEKKEQKNKNENANEKESESENKKTKEKENRIFPNSFHSVCKKLLRRMARVYGHIYYAHYSILLQLKIDIHVNTCFKHFIYFTLRYNMVNKQEFMAFGKIVTKLAPDLFLIQRQRPPKAIKQQGMRRTYSDQRQVSNHNGSHKRYGRQVERV